MKLWGERMGKETDPAVQRLNASLPFDIRLFRQDIQGSQAWARALARAGLLSDEELKSIQAGLEALLKEFEAGQFEPAPSDEDIHTAVERRLTELIGPLAGKLHTGRSRNDQVATDFRLWTMHACGVIDHALVELGQALVERAEEGIETPMPGYTHLQPAQPVTWGHWLLSHFWPLMRDRGRFAAARLRAAVLPLGAAALAGTTFPIDRQALAEDLGFQAVAPNSIDAVADRDFAAEFLFAAALLGVHLSRLAEALILFSNPSFGFVQLDDAYATGSSLMPQKKNPDPLELARGKAGRLIGRLTGLLATLKALPSAYDKDLQEDKEPVFEAFDTLELLLPVMVGLVRTLKVHPERMRAAIAPEVFATDLADYLVRQGLPFRQAHQVVGRAVRLAETRRVPLSRLSLEDLQALHPAFGEDVRQVFDLQAALSRRSVEGGTAPEAVQRQIDRARRALRG
jgi:argininosuccinate lyase